MKKDQIWDSKRHWFKFKFSLIFLGIGLLFSTLLILAMTIWNHDIVLCLVFGFLSIVFYSLFFAPIIKEFY